MRIIYAVHQWVSLICALFLLLLVLTGLPLLFRGEIHAWNTLNLPECGGPMAMTEIWQALPEATEAVRAASPASSWAEPQVLHNPAYAVLLDRDLHRHGPRSSPDLAQKRAHTSTSYGLLVLHPPTPQYQRKLTPTSPKTTKVS